MSHSKLMPIGEHDRNVMLTFHFRPEAFTDGTQLILNRPKASLPASGRLSTRTRCHHGQAGPVQLRVHQFLILQAGQPKLRPDSKKPSGEGPPGLQCMPISEETL